MESVLHCHDLQFKKQWPFKCMGMEILHFTEVRVIYDVERDVISYEPDEMGEVGMFISPEALKPNKNYFEVEIVYTGVDGSIVVGLVSNNHPTDKNPGWVPKSIGYRIGDGSLFRDSPMGMEFGPKFEAGDRIGCGIRFESFSSKQLLQNPVLIFFTKNGKEVGTCAFSCPVGGLFPAIGMHAVGDEVRMFLDMQLTPEEDMCMCIDSTEDEWARLHGIRLDGSILEYVGRGNSVIDVGLAQAKYPLDTTHHYYEIEILDPGKNCYIAIGLARKDYPLYRAPGWNKGSIAYHADDGKIFVGSGAGKPFGPKCHKGDIMGCGIIFPRDFVCLFEVCENNPHILLDLDDERSFDGESEDEEWWKDKENIETGVTIQVFFTRNGKTVGQKEVCIPKGGFYPTVGMLSCDEKVKVDLHPLTG